MKVRRLALLGLVLGVLAMAAAPAQAINDPRVPGDNCSPNNSSAVGDPKGGAFPNPGIDGHFANGHFTAGTDTTTKVDRFVSGNNPGVSTGALGQLNSNAIGTCPNS